MAVDSTPFCVLPSRRSWPLHDIAATRAIEQQALLIQPGHTLMQRAGASAAKLSLAIAPHARTVWIAAGPGNNGGDGLVLATRLHLAHRRVQVSLLADPQRLPADARWAWAQAREAGVAIIDALSMPADVDLAVDALLGLGANRPAAGDVAQAIRQLNDFAGPVLAIDVPSGLSADTGCVLGDVGVRASHTLSLLTLKPGLFTAQGRDHCGQVWLDRLGLDEPEPLATAHLNGPGVRQPRGHAQHKGSFGDVIVIGGAQGMGGAAMLAARAALTAGAGRVFVARLDDQCQADPLCPELMPRKVSDMVLPNVLAASTVVCGCGGGQAVVGHLPALLHHAARLVLDADALNAIAADQGLRGALQRRRGHGLTSIVTPHPLEAARLLGITTAAVQSDRIAHAAELARQLQCTVVLKGSGTVICSPSPGRVMVNPTGNARLGSAGTGDVLAGWIGGLWSQRKGDTLATAGSDGSLAVAADAVWWHGRAAEFDEPSQPLLASQLIDAIARAQWLHGG